MAAMCELCGELGWYDGYGGFDGFETTMLVDAVTPEIDSIVGVGRV
jgi:hypothetical protein